MSSNKPEIEVKAEEKKKEAENKGFDVDGLLKLIDSHNKDIKPWHLFVICSGLCGNSLGEIRANYCKYTGKKPSKPSFSSQISREISSLLKDYIEFEIDGYIKVEDYPNIVKKMEFFQESISRKCTVKSIYMTSQEIDDLHKLSKVEIIEFIEAKASLNFTDYI
ncbi:MAG: hypothetical protein AAFY50_04830 [Cyanobacteria bacterium J06648_1]